MKCKKAQVNILTVSSWQIVRIKRVTLLLRHPENKLIKSFLATVSFSTPFGNEAWNLTNVVSTLVMGRVPRHSNNHNCSLDLFFLQLICGWGEKNHPWVWLNIGYPPVIKHGNWTSSINGGVHGKIHNGGLSVAKFDYQRLPAKLPGDQTIWVAGFQRTPRKKDPVDNWNKHVGNQLISLHFWRVLMSDGSPSTSDQLRDQTWRLEPLQKPNSNP